ncbi:hypothetical protein ES703_102897 [subsurface metagenome]
MAKVVVSLDEEDVSELKVIVMDEDGDEGLKFLKHKILSQILRKEKSKMDVEGKTHL